VPGDIFTTETIRWQYPRRTLKNKGMRGGGGGMRGFSFYGWIAGGALTTSLTPLTILRRLLLPSPVSSHLAAASSTGSHVRRHYRRWRLFFISSSTGGWFTSGSPRSNVMNMEFIHLRGNPEGYIQFPSTSACWFNLFYLAFFSTNISGFSDLQKTFCFPLSHPCKSLG